MDNYYSTTSKVFEKYSLVNSKYSVTQNNKWIYYSNISSKNNFGYKIHISCSVHFLNFNIENILSFLLDLDVSFKIPNELDTARRLNNGDFGHSQVGKIITVYVNDKLEIISKISEYFQKTNGPIIPFEVPINKFKTVFLRFGAYKLSCVFDLFGRPITVYKDNSGQIIRDIRENKIVEEMLPAGITSFDEKIDIYSIIEGQFLPVKLISSNPKSKVYKGIKLSDFSNVIIKLIPNRFSGDIYNINSDDKAAREYDVLQILKENNFNDCAYPIKFIKTNDFTTIIMEEFQNSTSFDKLDKTTQFGKFKDIVSKINKLHHLGIIHADIKMKNILYDGNKILIIDFESSQKIDNRFPDNYGTKGYYISDLPYLNNFYDIDYISLISLLIGIYLGHDPSLIPFNQKKRIKILEILGYTKQAKLMTRIVNNPSIISDQNILDEITNLGLVKENQKSTSQFKTLDLMRTLDALDSSYSEELKGWRSNHLYSDFKLAALNIGDAGALLGAMIISMNNEIQLKDYFHQVAEGLANFNYGEESNGLYTGKAGQALVLMLYGKLTKSHSYIKTAKDKMLESIKITEEPDLFGGMAGILYTSILFSILENSDEFIEKSKPLYDKLLSDAKSLNGVTYWNPSGVLEKQKTPFVGLAHGSIGIAFSVYSYSNYIKDKNGIDFSIKTLKSIFKLLDVEKKSFKRYVSNENTQNSNLHFWCHGLIGYIWVIGQLELSDQVIFSNEINVCLKLLNETDLPLNPTICHGLAGVLEAYMGLIQNPTYSEIALEKCKLIEHLLFELSQTNKQGLVWSSESPDLITPDFMVGFSGTASVLSQYYSKYYTPTLSINQFNKIKLCKLLN